MPKISSMVMDGSRNDLMLVTFEDVTEVFRTRVLNWLRKQYDEFVKTVRWRDGKNRNVLLIEIWRSELAVAIAALKQALRRRSLFK